MLQIEKGNHVLWAYTIFVLVGCSRFDIAIDALQRVAPNDDIDIDVHDLVTEYHHQIREHEKYIQKYGTDPSYVSERPQF